MFKWNSAKIPCSPPPPRTSMYLCKDGAPSEGLAPAFKWIKHGRWRQVSPKCMTAVCNKWWKRDTERGRKSSWSEAGNTVLLRKQGVCVSSSVFLWLFLQLDPIFPAVSVTPIPLTAACRHHLLRPACPIYREEGYTSHLLAVFVSLLSGWHWGIVRVTEKCKNNVPDLKRMWSSGENTVHG